MARQRFLENVAAVVDDISDGAVCARRALQHPLAAQLTSATLLCGNLEATGMRWCICDKCM